MQNALWLAGVFGPFLMVIGLWMLVYQENMMKVIASMKNTPSILFLRGALNLLVGLTILNLFNTWAWHVTVLVTLLGWVYFVRGLMIFFIPQLFIKWSMDYPSWVKIKGIIPLILGFCLCWLAFWSR